MDTIQNIIDALAQSLHRSVAVDNAELKLIASSSHFADADRARLESLAGRKAEKAASDYVFGQGVRTWHTPRSLPANPEVGADTARFCLPLWSRYELSGFLWIMEKTPLSDVEIERATEAASKIRDLLSRQAQAASESEQEVEAMTFALLSLDGHERAAAVRDLSDYGLMKGATRFTVIVVSLDTDKAEEFTESPTSLIRRALAHLIHARSAGMTLSGISDPDSFLILGHRTVFHRDELHDIGTRLLKEVGRLDPNLARHVRVGIGTAQNNLFSVASSFDQAQQAARQAHRNKEAIAIWGEDALESLFDAVLNPECKIDLIPEAIRSLENDHAGMIEMLEIFLDAGGNVVKASERLHLHRTTVYYRLNKFQKATGLDIEDGPTRLMLHLWIKSKKRYVLSGAFPNPKPSQRRP